MYCSKVFSLRKFNHDFEGFFYLNKIIAILDLKGLNADIRLSSLYLIYSAIPKNKISIFIFKSMSISTFISVPEMVYYIYWMTVHFSVKHIKYKSFAFQSFTVRPRSILKLSKLIFTLLKPHRIWCTWIVHINSSFKRKYMFRIIFANGNPQKQVTLTIKWQINKYEVLNVVFRYNF